MKENFKLYAFILLMGLFLPPLNAAQELPFLDPEKTISMDFKDAGLKDILKIFSIQSGLNFIASESVQDRTVTVYLDNVPIQEALNKLFKANNLSYDLDRDSNIFIVKDWGKPEVETLTRIFYLKHATVSSSSLKEEMSAQLKSGAGGQGGGAGGGGGKWAVEGESGITQVVKKLLSEHGVVIEEYRTNSLIVRDIPSRIPVIAQTIASLDVPIPQVMLEVEMLDVSKNAVDKMGIKFPSSLVKLDMTTASRATGFPFASNYNKAFNPQGWTMTHADETAGGWTVGNWSAAHFGPSIFSVLNTQLTLDFLRTQSDTKYLARPRILTLNNEPAEIKITTQEAVGIMSTTTASEGTSTTTAQAERAETGVTLRVTPQINLEAGEITMFIVPTVAEASTGLFYENAAGDTVTFKDPEIRSTRSVVKVKDGETIIIGGLIRNDSSQVDTKVPLLGDIPIFGALFRHKDKTKDRERELLVFITPRIIKDSLTELAQSKKSNLAEREQETASSINRQEAINRNLNKFEQVR